VVAVRDSKARDEGDKYLNYISNNLCQVVICSHPAMIDQSLSLGDLKHEPP
jgi:hypothetical protein